jgi:hypothetical protein
MFDISDKSYLYSIIDLYLSDMISSECFCDSFHRCYDIELNPSCLTQKEEEIFCKYSRVFSRYSPIREDVILYPKVYIGDKQLKEEVKKAKISLEET